MSRPKPSRSRLPRIGLLPRAIRHALWAGLLANAQGVPADELPVPCTACAGGVFVSQGQIAGGLPSVDGNAMTIRQLTDRATLNWQSFNIGRESSVRFDQQKGPNSVALNLIHQADASRIAGRLNANGSVLLLNSNGIVFGGTAQVNVRSLTATTLKQSEAAVTDGVTRAIASQQPAYVAERDGQGQLASRDVVVERGARITAASGGQVFIAAPNIVNDGTIETPEGQSVLAAGEKVYVMGTADFSLRGILVEVDADAVQDADIEALARGEISRLPSGNVTNAGTITARAGNVTLAGLAVNQSGRVSATTTVRANGSIRLQARDRASILPPTQTPMTIEGNPVSGERAAVATRGGVVTVASGSVTEVVNDTVDRTQTQDVSPQPGSNVVLSGHRITVRSGATVQAVGGAIGLTAQSDPSAAPVPGTPDSSRILIERGATLTVAGSTVDLPAERNTVEAELRGDELKDFPVQRASALRSKKVTVDVRRAGTRADGTSWRGTPIADLSGYFSAVNRGVDERTVNGGSIGFTSQGDVIIADGALLDVSGGAVRYQPGLVETTWLVREGKVVNIANADPSLPYDGIFGSYTRTFRKWGQQDLFSIFDIGAEAVTGYVEGADAGAIAFNTPNLIADGTLLARTTAGVNQRKAPAALSGTDRRPFDQSPLSGRLVVGDAQGNQAANQINGLPNYRIGDVTFTRDEALPALVGFNPDRDPFPVGAVTTRIDPAWLGPNGGGFGRVAIYSNSTVTLPQGVSLDLGPAGSLAVTAGRVDAGSSIRSAGGSVGFAAVLTSGVDPSGIGGVLRSGARIDLSGDWVNDSPAVVDTPSGPAVIKGGGFGFSVNGGDLDLEAGALVDVSGGGQITVKRKLVAGTPGGISLAVASGTVGGAQVVVNLNPAAELRGFGLADGGTLAISANDLCISATACGTPADGQLTLTPEWFSRGGFDTFSLTANQGGFTVAPGTRLAPRTRSRLLGDGFETRVTGSALDSFSTIGLLPDLQRPPVSFTLTNIFKDPGDNVTLAPADVARAQYFTLGRGAAIEVEPQGSITLSSNARILIEGELRAPAGSISLALSAALALNSSSSYAPVQSVWFGPESIVDVGGVVTPVPDTLGRRDAEVLGAGSITVSATRGFVAVRPGAQFDISGVTAVVDVRTSADDVLGETYTPKTLAGAAGRLSLTGAEGVYFDGTLRAAHGAARAARGGRLDVTLSANARAEPDQATGLIFSYEPRVITVTSAAASELPADFAFGDALPQGLRGEAQLSATLLDAAGLDAIYLTARTLLQPDQGSGTERPGRVRLDGDVRLQAAQVLALNAAEIAATGNATLTAPYVQLGSDNQVFQGTPALAQGAGRLTVTAQNIDLVGASVVNGVDAVLLDASGDVRLRGTRITDSRSFLGSLRTAASDVTLRSAQIYGSTLSQFTLGIEGNGAGRIKTLASGGRATPVLSAGSRLTLSAPEVELGGVLKAPTGRIDVLSPNITLAAGSLTSVSAEGRTTLFGRTQAGTDWTYQLDSADTLVFDGSINLLPSRSITLAAQNVTIASGATLDVSGGGDLLAYEFQPGPSGSVDVLATGATARSFAILPGEDFNIAPYDPLEWQGAAITARDNLEPGAMVELAGTDGLPAGRYRLLPARYALLPGAWLVTEVDGYSDILPGESAPSFDGSTVIAGRRGVAGTPILAARTRGYSVRSGDTIGTIAEYSRATASSFFAERLSAVTDARTPADAGRLVLAVDNSLSLAGRLLGSSSAGRGAEVDIAAARIAIAAQSGSAGPTGFVTIGADALNALGAETLLLGGQRSTSGSTVAIDVIAQDIELLPGVGLEGSELLLAARDKVEVGEKASIKSSAERSGTLGGVTVRLDGDSALLRVSRGRQVEVVRSGSSGTSGSLVVNTGATVAARGSVTLDAAADTNFFGTLVADGGSARVGARSISLGDVPNSVTGLVLTDVILDGLKAEELILAATGLIDFYGAVDLAASELVLDAPGLLGRGGAGVDSSIDVSHLTLRHSAGVAPAPGSQSAGTLSISADSVDIAGGRFDFQGFESVAMTAAERVAGGSGVASLATTGDLRLVTPLVTVAGGGQFTVDATGALAACGSYSAALGCGSTAAGFDPVTQLGGRIDVHARELEIATAFVAPSGRIDFEARGSGANLVLHEGGLIDVSGRTRRYDGVAVDSHGGRVGLVSRSGDVVLDAGSSVDVRGAGDKGDGGDLTLAATTGSATLDGTLRGSGARGGRVNLDLDTLATGGVAGARLAALSQAGFTGAITARQRGGDLSIGAEDTVTADSIALSADAGSLTLSGRLLARDSVTLAARDAVTLADHARVEAKNDEPTGGRVAIYSASASDGTVATGGFFLGEDASIDVGGSRAPGEVLIRLPRATLATVTNASASDDRVSLAGAITGAGRVRLEGFRAYTDAAVTLDEVAPPDYQNGQAYTVGQFVVPRPGGPTGLRYRVTSGGTSPALGDPNWGTTVGSVTQLGNLRFVAEALPGIARFSDATTFMASASGIESALGVPGATHPEFEVVPGLELRSSNDLALNAAWNLRTWRFAGLPGVLTLRAAGNLAMNQSLSDGLVRYGAGTGTIEGPVSGPAWSYRLTGGADLAAANPLATLDPAALASDRGSITVAAGTASAGTALAVQRAVRTSTGDIDITAARNLTLGNRASVIYTAGAPDLANVAPVGSFDAEVNARGYSSQGGDIRIAVGGNVVGAATNQLISGWLYRAGRTGTFDGVSPTGYTVAFERFEQNVGALGGGDVSVRAGGDIVNLSASSNANGKQTGGTQSSGGSLEIVGGGDLDVDAGGDILSGVYYVGQGQALVRAGGRIAQATGGGRTVFVVGDTGADADAVATPSKAGASSLDVRAVRGLQVASVVNSTVITEPSYALSSLRRSYFFTYSPDTAVSLQTVSGDLVLDSSDVARFNSGSSAPVSNQQLSSDARLLVTYPPTLTAAALGGSLRVRDDLSLYPASRGNLQLFAEQDLSLSSGVNVLLSDTNPSEFPSLLQPASSGTTAVALLAVDSTLSTFRAPQPVHADASQPDGRPDLDPVRFVARTGDITFGDATGARPLIFLAKSARYTAGRDVIDATFNSQNLRAADISAVTAGRDITYRLVRLPRGAINTATAITTVQVDGPGTLSLEAGRDIDLKASNGIETRGNQVNPVLAEDGADVVLVAGLTGKDAAIDAYVEKYWQPGSPLAVAIREAMAQRLGRSNLSEAEALESFRQLDEIARKPIVYAAFNAELKRTGRIAASGGSNDYAEAFAAIGTLFPGTDYKGDVSLFFSKIYTLDGGDISLLLPGGAVNAGLSVPPSDFGFRDDKQLGIVARSTGDVNAFARGDFLVNSSRVFAADGGSILIWSSEGDIDAGRGAKTSLSAPPPLVVIDQNGNVRTIFPPALQGSGIRALVTTTGRKPGDVDLFAPAGVVNAGDAGIGAAGNITIGATEVIGAENIDVGGVSVGVPTADTGSLAAGLTGVGDVASNATKNAEEATEKLADSSTSDAARAVADSSFGVISVEILGFGEEKL